MHLVLARVPKGCAFAVGCAYPFLSCAFAFAFTIGDQAIRQSVGDYLKLYSQEILFLCLSFFCRTPSPSATHLTFGILWYKVHRGIGKKKQRRRLKGIGIKEMLCLWRSKIRSLFFNLNFTLWKGSLSKSNQKSFKVSYPMHFFYTFLAEVPS